MEAPNIGIIYASVDGHTKKICEHLQRILSQENIPTTLYSIDNFDAQVSDFHTLIIGASIRYGKHHKKVLKFIAQNRTALNQIRTAFFSVNLVARNQDKNSPETNPYLIKFLKQTQWVPNSVEVFAGQLDYKSYSFLDRIMIQFIMKLTHGPTKSETAIDYTDWNKVKNFGLRIKEQLLKS